MPRSIRVFRRNQTSTPAAMEDPGVLQVTSSLSGMLAGQCPDDKIALMVEALAKCFGTVNKSTAPIEYVWIECPPPDERWKLVCVAGTKLELDDGGETPVVIELAVQSIYPFV